MKKDLNFSLYCGLWFGGKSVWESRYSCMTDTIPADLVMVQLYAPCPWYSQWYIWQLGTLVWSPYSHINPGINTEEWQWHWWLTSSPSLLFMTQGRVFKPTYRNRKILYVVMGTRGVMCVVNIIVWFETISASMLEVHHPDHSSTAPATLKSQDVVSLVSSVSSVMMSDSSMLIFLLSLSFLLGVWVRETTASRARLKPAVCRNCHEAQISRAESQTEQQKHRTEIRSRLVHLHVEVWSASSLMPPIIGRR